MSGILTGLADLALQVSFTWRAVIGAIVGGLLGGFFFAYVPQWYRTEKGPSGMTMFGLKGNFDGLKFENNSLSGPGKLLDAEGNFNDVEIKNNKQNNRK